MFFNDGKCIPCDDPTNGIDNCSECSLISDNDSGDWDFSENCTLCSGGFMPQFDGSECVDRIDHCEDAPMNLQPANLVVDKTTGNYKCDTCEEKYYWNSINWVCEKCEVEDCERCNTFDTCSKCNKHKLL